jgi:hypothetical protein
MKYHNVVLTAGEAILERSSAFGVPRASKIVSATDGGCFALNGRRLECVSKQRQDHQTWMSGIPRQHFN